jgi:nickel/cobalt transporter (NicO) family protein
MSVLLCAEMRTALAAVAVTVALAAATPSAHRRDEYLQAARIGIDARRVLIELDLTPGIAVAPRILDEIDRDRNGVFSDNEARAYATRVLGELRVDVDGQVLALALSNSQTPTVDAILKGEGTIQYQLTAAVQTLTAGNHRLFYRNAHHADIGVYLANALVPATDRVVVLTQHRDVAQRELTIEYTLRDRQILEAPMWLFAIIAVAATLLAAELWRRSRNAPMTSR